jgi:membrane-associated phospholipid phosphatase
MLDFLFSEGPVKSLQELLTPLFEPLFLLITFTGSAVFLLALAVIVLWLWDKRVGFLLAIVVLSSAALNALLKDLFGMPRPSPELHRTYAEGNGFPSGHAQQSTAFWATVAQLFGRTWTVVSALLITFVALSRVYLGVHFVGDVLGGAAFGILVSLVGVMTYRMRIWQSMGLRERLVMALLLPALFPGSLLIVGLDVARAWGLVTGLAVGYILEAEWVGLERPRQVGAVIIRLLVGIPALGGLYATGWGLSGALGFAFHVVLGIAATLLLPWIFGMLEAFFLRRGSEG